MLFQFFQEYFLIFGELTTTVKLKSCHEKNISESLGKIYMKAHLAVTPCVSLTTSSASMKSHVNYDHTYYIKEFKILKYSYGDFVYNTF